MAMKLDPKNLKAVYRSGKAFYLLDKLDEAKEILEYGLSIDANNASIKDVLAKVGEKVEFAAQKERKKKEAELKRLREQRAMETALKARNFTSIARASKDMAAPDDFKLTLEDPQDPNSALLIPMTLYYPADNMFDMCPLFNESYQLQDALHETLIDSTPDWLRTDEQKKQYELSNLDLFCETISGGLARVKLDHTPTKILGSKAPRIPMVDERLAVYAVPKEKSSEFISQWKLGMEKKQS